jgi:hypothetical protein
VDDEGSARVDFLRPLMPPHSGVLDVVGLMMWMHGGPITQDDIQACFVACESSPPVLELDVRCTACRRLGNPFYTHADASTPMFCFMGSWEEAGRAVPHGASLGHSYEQFVDARPMWTMERDLVMYPDLWLALDPAHAGTKVVVSWQVFFKRRPEVQYHHVQHRLPAGCIWFKCEKVPRRAVIVHAVLRGEDVEVHDDAVCSPAPAWYPDTVITYKNDRLHAWSDSLRVVAGATSCTLVDLEGTGGSLDLDEGVALTLSFSRSLTSSAVLDLVYRTVGVDK